MSPLPQIRTLKKKPTAPTETNTPSVNTEGDTSETISPAPTTTLTTQSLAQPPTATSTATTTTEEIKEETGNSKNDLNGKTEISPVTSEAEGATDTQSPGEQSTDDPDADIDKPIFQALGTVKGKPEEDKENPGQFFIRLGGKRYGLFIAGYRYQAWLKQMAANPEQTLFLRVYPKCLMIPRKPPKIYFQVAAWEAENPWEEAPGLFKFRGIWQFVPQVRTPVISVYRNHNAEDPKGKFKATHIPVLMRRDDESAPFRFNPKIAKEELPSRWFIQGLFKFIPSRDSFGFSEDLEPPTKKIPYYKKPIKEVPGKDSEKGTENKSQKPSKKGTENKSEKPSGKKVEKPLKLNKEKDHESQESNNN
ncbi:MAG: hypothetical protein AB4062_04145 [Crocosphaera sp.]